MPCTFRECTHGKAHAAGRQGPRLQAREQPALAVLDVPWRPQPPRNHQGRKPRTGDRVRPRVVPPALRGRTAAAAGDAADAKLDGTVRPSPVGTDTPTDRRRRRTPTGPTFGQARHHPGRAQRAEQKGEHVRVHLLPFFGADRPVSDITSASSRKYRVHRQTSRIDPKTGEVRRPARSTLHSETVTLRQVLKTANRKGWISAVPDMSVAYKSSGKVSHRAWFSPAEYKLLYEVTRERAKHPKEERWREACERLHDYVLFMGNTGLRPDETQRLQTRDNVRKSKAAVRRPTSRGRDAAVKGQSARPAML